jgi:hypothetical protein
MKTLFAKKLKGCAEKIRHVSTTDVKPWVFLIVHGSKTSLLPPLIHPYMDAQSRPMAMYVIVASSGTEVDMKDTVGGGK